MAKPKLLVFLQGELGAELRRSIGDAEGVAITTKLEAAHMVVGRAPQTAHAAQTPVWVVNAETRAPAGALEVWPLPLAQATLDATLARCRALQSLNVDLTKMLQEMDEHVALAKRLDRGLRTTRFDEAQGVLAASFYCPGERPGGDYFDIAELKGGQRTVVLLSDASSYGLASSVMASLLRVSTAATQDPRALLEAAWTEIQRVLKAKDRWSVFIGTLDRRTLTLDTLHLGTSRAWLVAAESSQEILSQGEALTQASGLPKLSIAQHELQPGDTLVVSSDGWQDLGLEGAFAVELWSREHEPQAVANEAKRLLQKTLGGKETLPEQDCTLGIVQVNPKALRLARPAKDGFGAR